MFFRRGLKRRSQALVEKHDLILFSEAKANMNCVQTGKRYTSKAEGDHARASKRNPVGILKENLNRVPHELIGGLYAQSREPRPVAITLESTRPDVAPYILEVEVNCDECGGSGFDPGGIDPWGPEVCPACHGAKTQRIIRNYLAEAFQIAANPENTRPVERQHLIAVIHHCRQAVSALVSLPEVA